MTIELIPRGTLKNVYIVGQGLGQVSFQEIAATDEDLCGVESNNRELGHLVIPEISSPKRISVQIERLSLPGPGSKLDGNVWIYADGIAPVEVSLHVEQAGYKWYWTVPGWLLQILTPIIIGIGTFLTSKFFDAWYTERKELARFNDKHKEALNSFFENLYPTLSAESDQDFAGALQAALYHADRKWIGELPQSYEDKLLDALDSKKRSRIVSVLVRTFPRNRYKIKFPRKNDQ